MRLAQNRPSKWLIPSLLSPFFTSLLSLLFLIRPLSFSLSKNDPFFTTFVFVKPNTCFRCAFVLALPGRRWEKGGKQKGEKQGGHFSLLCFLNSLPIGIKESCSLQLVIPTFCTRLRCVFFRSTKAHKRFRMSPIPLFS